ncbi:MAG: bifunctional DNA-formamidopyrimidine glycosylase/DNA-(apurinic or apyrimidinic site) lyase [Longimicrobiales bacterium]
MPELPEAETIVRDLRPRLLGRRILSVAVRHPDVLGRTTDPERLHDAVAGATLAAVERRGKNVLLRLAEGPVLAFNLGMTGRLLTSDAPAAAGMAHVTVRFQLDNETELLFDDVRRFGRVDVYTPGDWALRTTELGVEPLEDEFTPERLHALTRTSRSPIRNWLLDQRRVAGIGNIYANEALFRAGVRPSRRANTLRREDTRRLRETLREVLAEAIGARGTTFRDYRDAQGDPGGYEPRLRVYDRAGQPCTTCGTAIKRAVLSNRSAFYCPQCQR